MRISDWSSDVCSSDLLPALGKGGAVPSGRVGNMNVSDIVTVPARWSLEGRADVRGVLGDLPRSPRPLRGSGALHCGTRCRRHPGASARQANGWKDPETHGCYL